MSSWLRREAEQFVRDNGREDFGYAQFGLLVLAEVERQVKQIRGGVIHSVSVVPCVSTWKECCDEILLHLGSLREG